MALQSKTWVTDEVLDAPDMNTYVRDNIDFLKPLVPQAVGKAAWSLSAAAATSGTTSFGVTFAASPVVLILPRAGSAIDLVVNVTSEPTTTGFNWRIATRNGNTFTGSGTLHWAAIGALA